MSLKYQDAVYELHRIIDLEDPGMRKSRMFKWINDHIHELSTTSVIAHEAAALSRIDVKKMERQRRFSMIGQALYDAKDVAEETERPHFQGQEYTTTLLILR